MFHISLTKLFYFPIHFPFHFYLQFVSFRLYIIYFNLFRDGEVIATYEGENKEEKILDFLKDPTAAPVKEKIIPWSEEESFVHHLNNTNFDEFLEVSIQELVMTALYTIRYLWSPYFVLLLLSVFKTTGNLHLSVDCVTALQSQSHMGCSNRQ